METAMSKTGWKLYEDKVLKPASRLNLKRDGTILVSTVGGSANIRSAEVRLSACECHPENFNHEKAHS